METMLVMAFIAIVLVVALIGLRIQITRGYDARRKADLTNIRRAFEEYYNDNDCYPNADILDNCGGSDLSPYIREIPCDPVDKTPYVYVPLSGNQCAGYAACVSLGDLGDNDIADLGCNPITGCGWGAGFNYCIASGIPILAPGFDPDAGTPTPSLSPTPPPGQYACSPSGGGSCNLYADPDVAGCPVNYADPNCTYMGVSQCSNPAHHCLW